MTKKYTLGPDIDLDQEVVRGRDGKRITEADAERIAAKALKRAGRPSLTGKAEHSPRLSIRVSPELDAELHRRAEETGTTPSAVAREVLESALRRTSASRRAPLKNTAQPARKRASA
jgi:hypothetical protein